MKKLVKTAKQQFEERLSELRLVERWEMCPTEIYYGCEMPNGIFVLLRDQDGEYKELQYGMRYIDLLMTEGFLSVTAERFVNGQIPIRPLFDWYASADHNDEPFNLLDIYMSELEESHYTFEDLYEEVSDVRIITAKEQWEEDSKNAKIAATPGNGSIYKVDVTEQAITFYVFKGDCYSKSVFPPFSELRKDNKFIIKYLELVRMSHDGDMDYALSWLAGGEYKMCELSLLDIYESASEIEGLEYEDKEFLQEQAIAKKDFSTEITDLKERMIKHITELYNQGMALDSDSFLTNAYSITWSDGSYYACENLISCKLTKSDEGVLCFSEIQENDKDVTYDSPLSTLTINTLWSIIDAIR